MIYKRSVGITVSIEDWGSIYVNNDDKLQIFIVDMDTSNSLQKKNLVGR